MRLVFFDLKHHASPKNRRSGGFFMGDWLADWPLAAQQLNFRQRERFGLTVEDQRIAFLQQG